MARRNPAAAQYCAEIMALFDGFASGLTARYWQVRAGHRITPYTIQQYRLAGAHEVLAFVQRAGDITRRYGVADRTGMENADTARYLGALRAMALDCLEDRVRRLMNTHQRLASTFTQPASEFRMLLQQDDTALPAKRIEPLVCRFAQAVFVPD